VVCQALREDKEAIIRKAFFAALAVSVAAAGVVGVALADWPRSATAVAIETRTSVFDTVGTNAGGVVVEYPEARHASLTISGANGLDHPQDRILVATDVGGVLGTNIIADLEFNAATSVVQVELDASTWRIFGQNLGDRDLLVRYNYTLTHPAPM